MLLTIYTVVVVILLFGVTIFVHELGHFLVARWLGLRAEVFSIGFGPALWKKKSGGVLYKIGILPLGGYVALPQMDPGGGDSPQTRDGEVLPNVPPWKKILVALAGVTCNMILAYFIACIVYWGGKSYAPQEEGALIGYVETNSVAYAEGLRIGDKILTVNDKTVSTWDEFLLTSAFYEEAILALEREDGTTQQVTLQTEHFMGANRVMGVAPLNYCYVLQVQPDSSASEAGLESGDRIVELAGIRLYSRNHMMQVVDEHRDQAVTALVDRAGETLTLEVTPKYDAEIDRALIGIQFNSVDVRTPWKQVSSHASLIFRFLKALVTPNEAKAAAGGVGGPIAIFTIFWMSVQADIILALWFTGLINVNLAIINMLPIPILDGGHVVFAVVESIRRKPMSPKFVAILSNAFAALLIALFVVLSWRDVARLPILSGSGDDASAIEQSVTNAPAE